MARPKLFVPEIVVVPVPAPAQIKARRQTCRISQESAGALVQCAERTWQGWEKGDREMPAGLWELFLLKTESILAAQAKKPSSDELG